jgi:hypothetical protein
LKYLHGGRGRSTEDMFYRKEESTQRRESGVRVKASGDLNEPHGFRGKQMPNYGTIEVGELPICVCGVGEFYLTKKDFRGSFNQKVRLTVPFVRDRRRESNPGTGVKSNRAFAFEAFFERSEDFLFVALPCPLGGRASSGIANTAKRRLREPTRKDGANGAKSFSGLHRARSGKELRHGYEAH